MKLFTLWLFFFLFLYLSLEISTYSIWIDRTNIIHKVDIEKYHASIWQNLSMYKLQKKLQTFIVPFLSIFLFCQHAHINTRTSNRFMLFWLHHARSCVSCQTLCARIKLHITANQSNLIEIISLHTISIGEKKKFPLERLFSFSKQYRQMCTLCCGHTVYITFSDEYAGLEIYISWVYTDLSFIQT